RSVQEGARGVVLRRSDSGAVARVDRGDAEVHGGASGVAGRALEAVQALVVVVRDAGVDVRRRGAAVVRLAQIEGRVRAVRRLRAARRLDGPTSVDADRVGAA